MQNGPDHERYSLALARNRRTRHANSNPPKEQVRKDQLAAKLCDLGPTVLGLAANPVCRLCDNCCWCVPSACTIHGISTGLVGNGQTKHAPIEIVYCTECACNLTCVVDNPLQRLVKVKTGADLSTRNEENKHRTVKDITDKVRK